MTLHTPLHPHRPPDPPFRILAADLGQQTDYTALIVLDRTISTAGVKTYTTRHISRLPEQTRYTKQAALIAAMAERLVEPVQSGNPMFPIVEPELAVVVDYTGVGRPVMDMVYAADPPGTIIPVTITGGERITWDEQSVKVPKRILASTMQVVLQEERILIPENAPLAPVMKTEMTGFRAKISLNGHITYAAGEDWRSAKHDDLVLSMALGLWYGEYDCEVSFR